MPKLQRGFVPIIILVVVIVIGIIAVVGFSNQVFLGEKTDYSINLVGEEDDDKVNISFRNRQWEKRINSALEPYKCQNIPKAKLPDDYYQGKLIDTHLHIPQLSDDFGGDDDFEKPRGSESDLYDTIPEKDKPILGKTVTIDEIACTLQQEGSSKAFAFFPVFPEFPSPLIEVVDRTMKRHPSLFIPFIQASASGVATVKGDVLQQMLDFNPGLFSGFGEVGDSPTEPINPLPDSPIYLGDFQVAQKNNLLVYFHPGVGHQKNLERAIKQFPEVTFIVHGDFVRPYIGELMSRNSNIYFTANDIFDEAIPQFRFGEKQVFIETMERDWDILLAQAVRQYKPLIEKYPDRFMWGTDRGDVVWNYDADIGVLLSKYGRAFIGQLSSEVQEKFAYKNAERLIIDR